MHKVSLSDTIYVLNIMNKYVRTVLKHKFRKLELMRDYSIIWFVIKLKGTLPTTGLWLGYNGLRYGPDQGIAKSPGKPWKMARLEIYGRRKNWVHFFSSLWQPLNCLGLIWIFSALFPGAAELSATEMAHSASPSSCPHSWQPADLGCRQTLLGSASR